MSNSFLRIIEAQDREYVHLSERIETLERENTRLRELIQQADDDLAGCGEITAETWRRIQEAAGGAHNWRMK